MLNLGENLRAYRKAAGYSQENFSRLSGISRQSLHRHEIGKVSPTPKHLAIYSKVLGITINELQQRTHPGTWKFKVFDELMWRGSS